MDPNHLKTVHGDFHLQFESSKPLDISFSKDFRFSSYKLPIKKDIIKRYQYLTGDAVDPCFYHYFAYPNLSYTSFLNIFFSKEEVVPMMSGCLVKTEFFLRLNAQAPDSLVGSAVEANVKLLCEDKKICEEWAPHYKVTGNWLPGEERIRAYVMVRLADETGKKCERP